MHLLTTRAVRVLATGILAALVLAACAGDDPLAEDDGGDAGDTDEAGDADDGGDVEAVTVGSANFPESVMLANMYALAIEETGVEVTTRTNIGAREVYFPALREGEIDVLPEYAGSLLNFLSDDPVEETDTEVLIERLREELEPEVRVLDPSEAENRNGLVVTRETAEEHDLSTTSDLAPVAGELVAGGAPEARERPDGLPGLERVYGIEFSEFVDLDPGGPLTIEALKNGDIDVARLFTSQGVIAANDWVVLDDDGGLIPSENITPVIRDDALNDEIRDALEQISQALTLDELIELNRRVEVDNEDPDLVAEDWLGEQGLIS